MSPTTAARSAARSFAFSPSSLPSAFSARAAVAVAVGSTPCNVASSFLTTDGRVDILSGVNLAMVMRLACQPRQEGNLKELERWLQAKTQKSVCLASDLQSGKKCEIVPAVSAVAKTAGND